MIRKIASLLITITIVVIVFIAGEIAIDVIRERRASTEENKTASFASGEKRKWRKDPVLHHTHIPNAEYIWVAADRKEFEQLVKYNSRGLHDHEYDYKKGDNTKRILVFGDSFVEAVQVKKEENFCKLIEKDLNSGDSPDNFEVLNMGVSAYSPILEYLYLKNEGLKYDPDMIVVVFFMNDVYEDLLHKAYAEFDAEDLPLSVPFYEPDKTKELKGRKGFERKLSASVKNLLNRSKVYVFFKKKLYRILAMMKLKELEPESEAFFILYNNASAKEKEAWNDTFRYILGMKELAESIGAGFLFVTIPVEPQLIDKKGSAASYFYFTEQPDSERCETKIKDFCARHDINYISMLDEFRKRESKGLYFKKNGHFNAKGHREVADILSSFLLEN